MAERICEGKRPISYEDFLATVYRAPCQTLSGHARPCEGETAYQYDCQLTELIQRPLYPAWFVNEARTEFRNYNHPEARPIRVEELAALDLLVRSKLEPWYKPDLGVIAGASVIVLHCAGCDRRVLADGVHRTVWLLNYGKTSTMVHVTELSGMQWPRETPDLNVVCRCTGR